jgi:hypothetical protein
LKERKPLRPDNLVGRNNRSFPGAENVSDAAEVADVEPSAASGGGWGSGREKAYGPAGTVRTGSY